MLNAAIFPLFLASTALCFGSADINLSLIDLGARGEHLYNVNNSTNSVMCCYHY